MCGIFGILNYDIKSEELRKQIHNHFMMGSKRGPEFSKINYVNQYIMIGFHRLAINGLNPKSHQPFHILDTQSVTNGEIYNHVELTNKFDFKMKTQSDCEVITHLYSFVQEHCFNMLVVYCNNHF